MVYQIDQSGKIEDTAKDTVVGISNGWSYTIKLRAKAKRQLQERCRANLQGRLFVYRTFAALIFLLIKNAKIILVDIVIDQEYPGKEKIIKDILLEFLRKNNLPEPHISFARIGSRPKVHYLAYNVFTGKSQTNKMASLKELEKLVIKKRKDRGPKRLKST